MNTILRYADDKRVDGRQRKKTPGPPRRCSNKGEGIKKKKKHILESQKIYAC